MTTKPKKATEKNIPPKGSTYVASAENDITLPFWNDVLPLQDPTINAKAPHKGLALYEELKSDARIRGPLSKRRAKLVRREWSVEVDSEDPRDLEARDLCESALNGFAFDALCRDLCDATLKGFAVAEIIWGRNEDGYIVPIGYKDHDQVRFRFDKNWNPRLLTRDDPHIGRELPKRKFIVHRHEARANNPYGLGLGSTLYWHVLFKREGIGFWAIFLEKFASPTPVGKYPDGWTKKQIDDLVGTLRGMVQSGALAVPIGSEVDYLEASRAGEAGYEKWTRYWDEQSVELINGETLTTNIQGSGARAASETHQEEGELVVDSDGDLQAETLKATLLRWIVELNYPGAKCPTVKRHRPKNEAQEEELKSKKHKRQQEALKTLRQLKAEGYQPADLEAWLEDQLGCELQELDPEVQQQAREMLNPPKPANSNKGSSSNTKNGDASEEELREAAAQFVAQFSEAPTGSVDHLVDQLLALGDDGFEELMEQLEKQFGEADDYADLSARLLDLIALRDDSQSASNFGDALALADLTGRGEIYDETGVRATFPKRSKKKSKIV